MEREKYWERFRTFGCTKTESGEHTFSGGDDDIELDTVNEHLEIELAALWISVHWKVMGAHWVPLYQRLNLIAPHLKRDQIALAPIVHRQPGGQHEAEQQHKRQVDARLEAHHRVRVQIVQRDPAAGLEHLRTLAQQNPANMSEKDSTPNVVRILDGLAELVVNPVIPCPSDDRLLKRERLAEHQEDAQRKPRFVGCWTGLEVAFL